ncbi:MAG: tRNA 2-thiouridine(34) synthase MnmA [Planctomycetota bacterium]
MSIDLDLIPKGEGRRVLVAMSGGVDSSAAAAMLIERGWEVVGCFMRLGSPGETLDELQPFDTAGVSCDPAKVKIGHQGCCSINDAADARLVAAHLGASFYVCNFKKDFGRIIDYFVEEYASGRTPNPCVRCNDWLKFGKLHEYAGQVGAEFVASGHYARVADGTDGEPELLRGVDESKDQSYVLFGASRARLRSMLLPIGHFEKPDVRAYAEAKGLPVFDKPDSQEICFVPDQDYAGLVERRLPDLAKPGEIVDRSGAVLGEHGGQHRFTVGQRRGVGVALGHPIYVVERQPETNRVVVGEREELEATSFIAGEANWIGRAEHDNWTQALAQVRYNAAAVPCRFRVIQPRDGDTPSGRTGRFEVEFETPEFAVAPGQAAVLYEAERPERVLGGGWIERAVRSVDADGSERAG